MKFTEKQISRYYEEKVTPEAYRRMAHLPEEHYPFIISYVCYDIIFEDTLNSFFEMIALEVYTQFTRNMSAKKVMHNHKIDLFDDLFQHYYFSVNESVSKLYEEEARKIIAINQNGDIYSSWSLLKFCEWSINFLARYTKKSENSDSVASDRPSIASEDELKKYYQEIRKKRGVI